ncbi:MAG: hypothetical protein ACI4U3_08570 [Traorella sp.]
MNINENNNWKDHDYFRGISCIYNIFCLFASLIEKDIRFQDRILILATFAILAVVSGIVCKLGFKFKQNKTNENKEKKQINSKEQLMTSQYAALYLQNNKNIYHDKYIEYLEKLDLVKKMHKRCLILNVK